MVVGLLLALLTPVQPSAAGGYEVIWDSWFPEQCRQFGDNTTSADFERFGITFNEKLSPGIPALPPQHPSGDTGRAGDRFVLFYENFGAATLRVSLSQCSTAMVPRPAAAPPLSPAWIFAPPVGLYPAIGAHAGNFSGTSLYMCDPQQVRSMNPCLRAMSVAAGPVSGDRNAGCTACGASDCAGSAALVQRRGATAGELDRPCCQDPKRHRDRHPRSGVGRFGVYRLRELAAGPSGNTVSLRRPSVYAAMHRRKTVLLSPIHDCESTVTVSVAAWLPSGVGLE